MKRIKSFFTRRFLVLMAALVSAAPLTVLAQASGLVPCGNNTSSDYISSAAGNTNYMLATACSFCNLAQLIQNVVNFLIMISIPISVAMFAWAGIIFFTNAGNPKRIAHAKQIFSSVFIGFIIAVSGWLVVQIVLQSITNSNFYLANNWTALQCGARPRDLQLQNVLTGVTVTAVPNTALQNPMSPDPTNPGSNFDLNSAITAICQIESGCGQNVDNGNGSGCNSAGACGPMQIKPATACATNSSFSSGCGQNGNVIDSGRVAADLQDKTNSQILAGQILTQAQNSSQCNGSLDCAVAIYTGDPTALAPSACCSQGAAYQCPYDCGTTVPRSSQCDVSPTAACVPAATCTAASAGRCTAYGYLQLVKRGGH